MCHAVFGLRLHPVQPLSCFPVSWACAGLHAASGQQQLLQHQQQNNTAAGSFMFALSDGWHRTDCTAFAASCKVGILCPWSKLCWGVGIRLSPSVCHLLKKQDSTACPLCRATQLWCWHACCVRGKHDIDVKATSVIMVQSLPCIQPGSVVHCCLALTDCNGRAVDDVSSSLLHTSEP